MQKPLFNSLPREGVEEQLKALWLDAFGDSPEFVDAFFSHFPSEECAHVLSVGDRVVSMLFALPFTYCYDGGEVPAAYLYAVATVADCRGRGYMRRLLESVEALLRDRGVSFVFLLPASDGLRRYYTALGFATCSSMALERFSVSLGEEGSGLSFCEVDDVDAVWNFCVKMQRAVGPSILHSRASIAMNIYNCRAQGGGVFALLKGGQVEAVAFVVREGGDVLLLEHYFCSPLAEEFMHQSLCRHFGVDELCACCAGRGDAFCMMRNISLPEVVLAPDIKMSLLLNK